MSDTVRKVMLQETPEGHTYSDILFDPKIFKVEDDANYGETVKLMDTARGAGAEVLGIVTKD